MWWKQTIVSYKLKIPPPHYITSLIVCAWPAASFPLHSSANYYFSNYIKYYLLLWSNWKCLWSKWKYLLLRRNSRRKSFPQGKFTLKLVTGATPRTWSCNNFAHGSFHTRCSDPYQKLESRSRWIFSASPETKCWYAFRDLALLAAVHGSV